MDLHVLRRVDRDMLQPHRSNDAHAWAEALASGHAFDVEVLAVFPKMGEHLARLQWHLGPAMKGNWYKESFKTVLRALLDSLEEESKQPEAPAAPVADLESLLEPCCNVDADAMVRVREACNERLGSEAAKELLAGLKQVVLPDATGRKRRVFRDSQGRALRLRV